MNLCEKKLCQNLQLHPHVLKGGGEDSIHNCMQLKEAPKPKVS
jgi:hypothetical protein